MSTSKYSVDYQFIVRVLRSEAGQEEQEYFIQWLNESEEHKAEFAAVSLLWDSMEQSRLPEPPDAGSQWEAVAGKISRLEAERLLAPEMPHESVAAHGVARRDDDRAPHRGPRRIAVSGIFRMLAASAAVVAVLAVSWIVRSKIDLRPAAAAPEYAAVTTHNGEKIVLTLTDGTMVYLNAGSRLTYPRAFADSMRVVGLEGEGYFAVAKDPAKPFRIVTGTTVTQVTGTEFNVRFRRDSLVVAVTKGSVTVAQQAKSGAVHLQPGDAAICARNRLTSYSHVDLEQYVAWRKNRLAFTRAPLRTVMDEIERCFNVDVKFTKERIQRKTLTGVFSTESLDSILGTIALAMDLRIQRNGRTVLIQ